MPGAEQLRIRPVRADEARAVAEVFDAAVRAGWGFVDDLEDLMPMFPPEFWDGFVADVAAPDVVLVATVPGDGGERVVGYVGTHGAEGELWVLFVHPRHGGGGVGRRLLEAAHASLRQVGRTEAFLFTHEGNHHAQRFYEAAGYRRDGGSREEELGGQRLREVRMVAPLGEGPGPAP